MSDGAASITSQSLPMNGHTRRYGQCHHRVTNGYGQALRSTCLRDSRETVEKAGCGARDKVVGAHCVVDAHRRRLDQVRDQERRMARDEHHVTCICCKSARSCRRHARCPEATHQQLPNHNTTQKRAKFHN